MSRWKWSLIICGFVLVSDASANRGVAMCASENPYLSVVTNRNLFQLVLLKPADVAATHQRPPLREVKLSGITTLPDATRAILRVMCAAQPPEPAKEISLFLTAGGRAEIGVQVLEIDVARGLVRICNDGTLQTLDITQNLPKGSPAPPPTGVTPTPTPPTGKSAVPDSGARRIASNEEQAWTVALRR